MILIIALMGNGPSDQGLSGTYIYRQRGMAGRMTISDHVGQPANVVIETGKITPAHDTCFVNIRAQRGADGAFSGPAIEEDDSPVAAPGCTVTISRMGPRHLRVSENQCWIAVCGVHARFDGEYWLSRR